MTDTWLVTAERRHNLETFRHQPKVPRKVVRRQFTEAQLRIARADHERRMKTASQPNMKESK